MRDRLPPAAVGECASRDATRRCMPSVLTAGFGGWTCSDSRLATTEFLVVDTETNGRAGDACELTEVGAVLVGGGELHDRWETLVGGVAPLSRAIQRFTRSRRGWSTRRLPPTPCCPTSPS